MSLGTTRGTGFGRVLRGPRRSLGAALATAAVLVAAPALTPPAAAEERCDVNNPRLIDSEPSLPLIRMGVPQAWQQVGTTGKGVTVAVVDSGVEADNRHFTTIGETVLPGRSFVPGDESGDGRTDVYAHGTGVAGTIAAGPVEGSKVYGAAWRAKILPVRVYARESVNGEEVPEAERPSTVRMADGIRWAALKGADVINVSMSTQSDENLDYLEAAVRFAVSRDAVIVASGGNRPTGTEPHSARYPAAFPGVIGVAASDPSDQITESTVHGSHIDVAAPGQRVLTTFLDADDCIVGADQPYTSYATGYVSGVAALLRERYPKESAETIAYRIMASADRPQRGERDDLRGWGIVQAYQALTMTLDPNRLGPPFPGAEEEDRTRATPVVGPVRAATDPLEPVRQQALWWSILGAGLVSLALVLRPWAHRHLARRD
ncbi:MAG TPA: S8 family serine peptidase [Nocardioidaceae bacterium]|nr:S8 family serine peptidase [Nocardioidaceae bacterium]